MNSLGFLDTNGTSPVKFVACFEYVYTGVAGGLVARG